MTRQAQAATLQLDPVRDQDEYNAFISFLAQIGGQDIGVMPEGLRSAPASSRSPGGWRTSAARVAGVGPRPPLRSGRRHGDEGRHRDGLGGFGDPAEPAAVCLEVVDELWAQRDRRVPTLLVIDEAHNLCGTEPATQARRGCSTAHPDRRRGPQVRALAVARPAEAVEDPSADPQPVTTSCSCG